MTTFKSMEQRLENDTQKNNELTNEIASLKNIIQKMHKSRQSGGFKGWTDYILHVCRDGQQRTAIEIFNEIELMDHRPWPPFGESPKKTCNANCGNLFRKQQH